MYVSNQINRNAYNYTTQCPITTSFSKFISMKKQFFFYIAELVSGPYRKILVPTRTNASFGRRFEEERLKKVIYFSRYGRTLAKIHAFSSPHDESVRTQKPLE